MKLADLEKNKGLKINSRMKQAVNPGRFGAEAVAAPDRREQRKRDQAQGLVAFAAKLPGDLVAQLQALARQQSLSVNEVVAELLKKALRE